MFVDIDRRYAILTDPGPSEVDDPYPGVDQTGQALSVVGGISGISRIEDELDVGEVRHVQ